MFFAETLGPILTPITAKELGAFLRRKLAGRTTASAEQLRELVSEYMYIANIRTTADSVIDFLARNRVIVFQGATPGDAARFEVAA
jgi:hypothetical protein